MASDQIGRLKTIRDKVFSGNQSEMARITGLNASTLSRLFNRETETPSEETLQKVLNSVSDERGRSLNEKWLRDGKGEMFENGATPSVSLPAESDQEADLASLFRQDTVMTVHLEAKVAAGTGRVVYPDDATQEVSVPRGFLSRLLGFHPPKRIGVMEAAGDSMEPTIERGDLVIWEPVEERQIRDADVYVIHMNGGLTVKRVQPLPDGSVRIIPDNQHRRYTESTLIPTESEGEYRMEETGRTARMYPAGRVLFPDRSTDKVHVQQVGEIIRSVVRGNGDLRQYSS